LSNDFYKTSILPYAGIIIKLCRAYTNSQEDFEDYYQEVCLQIWRSKENFREESEWSTWVYRISLNVCLTLLKKKKNNSQHFVSDSLTTQETLMPIVQALKTREVTNEAILNSGFHLIYGIPTFMWIIAIVIAVLIYVFGANIYAWDVNLVYGRVFQKLDELIADIDELKN
jgi:RNA polymerase sigma factor (sigma-70 family)